jgi:hypothetical protein
MGDALFGPTWFQRNPGTPPPRTPGLLRPIAPPFPLPTMLPRLGDRGTLSVMHAHRIHVTIGEPRELRLPLPHDFPRGEAEVIVLASRHEAPPGEIRVQHLDAWLASLPPAPTVPLRSMDREEIYR